MCIPSSCRTCFTAQWLLQLESSLASLGRPFSYSPSSSTHLESRKPASLRMNYSDHGLRARIIAKVKAPAASTQMAAPTSPTHCSTPTSGRSTETTTTSPRNSTTASMGTRAAASTPSLVLREEGQSPGPVVGAFKEMPDDV